MDDLVAHRPAASAARRWVRRIHQVFVLVGTMAAVLLGVAGRIDWSGAWIVAAAYLVFLLSVLTWGMLHAPELIDERSRKAANVKGWDTIVAVVYTVLLFALMVTAALDAGRYRWSVVPAGVQLIAWAVAVSCGLLLWSAMRANAFSSKWARIQNDRGHTVVDAGPYARVRHPMYLAIMMLEFAVPLMLQSWLALVPGGLIAALFVIRAALEDRMLHDELPGYRDYANRVRYRLVPGVW